MRLTRGYTLIEILISIAVFGILASITVLGFQNAGKINAIRQNAGTFVADLRRLQTLATSGGGVMACVNQTPTRTCTSNGECTSNDCQLMYPPGGFGVFVDPAGDRVSYALYARLAPTVGYSPGVDPLIELGNGRLTDDVEFETVDTDVGSNTGVITFTSPRGTASNDATFCLTRKGFPSMHRVVSVLATIGQVTEKSVSGPCPTDT